MIRKENLLQVGRLMKTHGVKGEVNLLFDKELFADVDSPFYFLEIDGVYVPFFVEEMRFGSSLSARVKFEDVNSLTSAERLVNLYVFVPAELVQEESDVLIDNPWEQFVGYSVVDDLLGPLGVIDYVDSSTINVLFVVKHEEKEFLIPATEDFISKIDASQKVIYMTLPEGLIE